MPEVRYSLRGELDAADCSRIESDFQRLLAAAADVLVDCAQLTFIDSKAVGTLCQLRLMLEARGHYLLLSNVTGLPLRVFEYLDLVDTLNVNGARDGQR